MRPHLCPTYHPAVQMKLSFLALSARSATRLVWLCRVAALLAAKHAIEHEGRQAVAIVAGDTVASPPLQEFLARADGSCSGSSGASVQVPSPVIPNLYDRVARWHRQQYGTTREQLVGTGCSVLVLLQLAQVSLTGRSELWQVSTVTAAVCNTARQTQRMLACMTPTSHSKGVKPPRQVLQPPLQPCKCSCRAGSLSLNADLVPSGASSAALQSTGTAMTH